jgi:hypothetical protein
MEFVRWRFEEKEREIREWLEHCSFVDNLYIKRPNGPNDCRNERGSR